VEVEVLGIFERLRRVVCEESAFVGLVICVALVLILGLFVIGLLMTDDNDGLPVLLTLLITR
jgi:hypothetical protein